MATVLLVSTYELGHQPVHLAVPAGELRRRGHEVRTVDLAVEAWDEAFLDGVDAVAVSVPMHTATRLAWELAGRLPAGVPLCAYGLYAAEASRHPRFDRAVAGEYLPALTAWVDAGGRGVSVDVGRHRTGRPDRTGLAPLDRYAHLVGGPGGERRPAGAVETARGCASRCRHCPVPAVYDGRTRIVEAEAVLADVDQLVAAGARHLTYADPDFLSAPRHSLAVARAVHERHPALTFDVTTKVELILRHRAIWPELAGLGCLFVTTAVECVDDAVLARLDKGHTAADAAEAVTVLRDADITPRPSLLPFTPWTTWDGLVSLVRFVADHDLAADVEPVHWSIRLLVPEGSLLAAEVPPDWRSDDPRLDELQARLAALAEAGAGTDRLTAEILAAAGEDAAAAAVPTGPGGPRLSEAWFCCAEPTGDQLAPLR